MPSGHYILEGKKIVRCDDLRKWSEWFEHSDRRVALTKLSEHVKVSTVFLGSDHGFGRTDQPILFETLIFGGPRDGDGLRATSWGEAEATHRAFVEIAREALGLPMDEQAQIIGLMGEN